VNNKNGFAGVILQWTPMETLHVIPVPFNKVGAESQILPWRNPMQSVVNDGLEE